MGMDATLEIAIQCKEAGFLYLKISTRSAVCSFCSQILASHFSRFFTLDTVSPIPPQGLSFPVSAQRTGVSSCGVPCGSEQLRARYGHSSSKSTRAPLASRLNVTPDLSSRGFVPQLTLVLSSWSTCSQ